MRASQSVSRGLRIAPSPKSALLAVVSILQTGDWHSSHTLWTPLSVANAVLCHSPVSRASACNPASSASHTSSTVAFAHASVWRPTLAWTSISLSSDQPRSSRWFPKRCPSPDSTVSPNHALQRGRPSRCCCHRGVPRAGSLSLGSSSRCGGEGKDERWVRVRSRSALRGDSCWRWSPRGRAVIEEGAPLFSVAEAGETC